MIFVLLQLVGEPAIPLNVTVLVPCGEPKFVPVIVTEVPTVPDVGERLVMLGVGSTVKLVGLLSTPLACTTTFPVVAPVGTGTTMLVSLQLVGVPAFVLNFTVLLPCVAPNPLPVTVTEVPMGAAVGERVAIFGAGTTVKFTPALATPETVTTTFPVVAPAGTGTTIFVLPQLVVVPVTPLNVIVLLPCVAPKFVPVTVTNAPTAPPVGDKLVMPGAALADWLNKKSGKRRAARTATEYHRRKRILSTPLRSKVLIGNS
jgi:hypothetical protein